MSGGWTKGEWFVDEETYYSVDRDDEDGLCASGWKVISNSSNPRFVIVAVDVNCPNHYNDQLLDDVAKFVIEAGTVANETGPPPRQLADQNRELLAALREVIPANLCITNPNVADDQIVPVDVTMGEFRKIAALIAKCTGAA